MLNFWSRLRPLLLSLIHHPASFCMVIRNDIGQHSETVALCKNMSDGFQLKAVERFIFKGS